MTDRIVFDASFGHARITSSAMSATSADGVILYAGCDATAKNATKAEVQRLLNAGVAVGLVIENFPADAMGGAAVGTAQGRAIVAGAKSVGYDWRNCVLFGGYDTDSHRGDWARLLAYMEAFAREVPVPGFYGDSDSIDYLHARHPDWVFWQSNSRSFSPLNPSPNSHLQQLYNDPRAGGLPVDVNIVRRTPLRLMGEETMPLTDTEIQKIADAVWAKKFISPTNGKTYNASSYLVYANIFAGQAKTAIAKLPGVVVDAAAVAQDIKQRVITLLGGQA